MDLNRLKRFDKAKHDQLAGLLEWCQLMGLSGKDLVSLGGHIDRAEKSGQAKANRKLAETIVFDTVGKDDMDMRAKWSYKTVNGRYTFFEESWHRVTIHSNATKARKTFSMTHYELGKLSWKNRTRLMCAMNIINGDIKLDF